MTNWEVCPRCHGEGKYVNPAIDGHGLTAEDIDQFGGDEFMEDYLGGTYDIECEVCHGRRVVSEEERKDWDDEAEARAEQAAEMRMMGEW